MAASHPINPRQTENEIPDLIFYRNMKLDQWPFTGHFLLVVVSGTVIVEDKRGKRKFKKGNMVLLSTEDTLSIFGRTRAEILIYRIHDKIKDAICNFYKENFIRMIPDDYFASAFSSYTIPDRVMKYICGFACMLEVDLPDRKSRDGFIRTCQSFILISPTKETLVRFLCPLIDPEFGFMKKVLDSLDENKTLEEIARNDILLTPSGFNKRFKRVFGMTPKDFEMNRKFKKIGLDLNYSSLTIDEIREKYGYGKNSIASFTDMCRKYLGAKPEEYRKNNPQYNSYGAFLYP